PCSAPQQVRAPLPTRVCRRPPLRGRAIDVRGHRLEETVLCKRLGQVLVRTDHATAGPVEQTILRGQDEHWGALELAVFLDQGARLVTVQARHHDIYEHQVRLVVGDFGEG